MLVGTVKGFGDTRHGHVVVQDLQSAPGDRKDGDRYLTMAVMCPELHVDE